ncbi:hypothetical protein DFP73DRAFT_528391 [Morchella snyderi]|nr:hypothetical protein DFP73DRAFT_528391 [Morchella snyderi]
MAKTMMGWSLHNSNTWSKPLASPPTRVTPPKTSGKCTSFSKNPLPLANAPANDTAPTAAGSATTNPLDTLRTYHKNSTTFPSPQELPAPAPATANLLQIYYAYFHSAHPFVLPPAQLITTPASQLMVLLPVIRFVASFFAQNAPTETFRQDAEAALFNNPPRNAFTVQALLLFAIALHSDNDQERCAEVKDKAIELALDLGMNMSDFSESSYNGSLAGKVLAERAGDGPAGFHQKDSFKLWSLPCTVPLPCEEKDYIKGNIPEPKSLQEFDARYFALEQVVFSSFAYRVDAVRILGQVLAVGQGSEQEDPKADAADASLVNWGLHLPSCKKELVGNDRRVDEMLFQAHMVVHAATIYLHRPKSHLAISLVPSDTSCTSPESWSTSTKPIAMHTAKAITAANTIAKLVTLPAPLIKHTPFFTCVITLAAIVHLSACSWLLTGDEGFLAKERIRLGVGALKTLGEVWSVADCVLMQVKGVAREVFAMHIPEGTQRTGIITAEEVFRYIDEERTLEIVGGDADYHGMPELDWNGEWNVLP